MSIRPPGAHRGGSRRHRAGRGPVQAAHDARLVRVALCAAVVVAVLAAGAPWVLHRVRGPTSAAAVTSAPPAASQPPAGTRAPAVAVPAGLVSAFQRLTDDIGAQIGLAYAPVDHPAQVRTLGTWSAGPAWSTIKVPLSLALLRQEGTGEVTDAMRSAITKSDNAAAQRIWESLGAHQSAADKVQAVLADAGPPIPHVPSEVSRPGFSVFGQTEWSLDDQARFLAHAACQVRDTPVLDLMGDVVSSQRWGLGTLDGARIKGGWGPGRDGHYLVRQYGLVGTAHGQLAVAIAAVADAGGFGDGTTALNRMASWLQDHLDALGGGRCSTA